MIARWPVNGDRRGQPGVRLLDPEASHPHPFLPARRPGLERQIARPDAEQRREETEHRPVGGAPFGGRPDPQTQGVTVEAREPRPGRARTHP